MAPLKTVCSIHKDTNKINENWKYKNNEVHSDDTK
jgi:hypothetical protein